MRRLILAVLVVIATVVLTEVRLSDGELRLIEPRIGVPSLWEPRPPENDIKIVGWPLNSPEPR